MRKILATLSIALCAFFTAATVNAAEEKEIEYRVLNLPGGGAAGVTTLVVLAQLEQDLEMPTYKIFDEIWGASIGSLIAALLTTKRGDEEPLSAQDLLELLEEDVFNGYLPFGPKVIGYAQALGIFNFIRANLASNPSIASTLIPIQILTAEIVSWKKNIVAKDVNHCFIKSSDRGVDGAAISLSDTVCASCNVLGFFYHLTQDIEGLEPHRCFRDSGLNGPMNPCQMRPQPFSDAHASTLYFLGNGWINDNDNKYSFNQKYSIGFNFSLCSKSGKKKLGQARRLKNSVTAIKM